MDQVTLRVSADTKESLQREANEADKTLSEYMRDLIANRNQDSELAERHERLREDHERLRTDHDRLQDEFERVQSENETLQAEHERLQEENEHLHEENERLQREKRMILENQEDRAALVEYVEDERQLDKKREHANLFQRAKWWVTGVPKDEE